MELCLSNFDVRIGRRRGFSFTELLFAVMILGVGFIMLAAVFPVGLSQTKSNFDENVGASISKLSVENINGLATNVNMPATPPMTPVAGTLDAGKSISLGTVMSFRDRRMPTTLWPWNRITQSMMLPTDSRFAWTALYMRKIKYTNNTATALALSTGRDTTTGAAIMNTGAGQLDAEPETMAQLIIIGLRINNKSEYTFKDHAVSPSPYFYQVEPKPIYLTMDLDPETGGYIAHFKPITDVSPSVPYHGFATMPTGIAYETLNAVAPGSVVVISDDRITAPKEASGRMNGRIFKVGEKLDETVYGDNAWELLPGNDRVLDYGPNGKPDASINPTGDDITQIGSFNQVIVAPKSTEPTVNTTKNAGTLGVYDTIHNCNSTDIAIDASSPTVSGLATAFIIGRGYSNPDNETAIYTPGTTAPITTISRYEGDAQDVAVYTTFVRVK